MYEQRRIGYACTLLSQPYRTSRTFMLKNFNEGLFRQTMSANLADLARILEWNVKHGIMMFRISSDIVPFGSHTSNTLPWWTMFEKELRLIGLYIKEHALRVSMHPGQYTVLNSPSEEILQRSIADLEYHSRFLDCLGVDQSHKIVLHVGGQYGDKMSSMQRFIDHFPRLSSSVQRRLVVENDDRSYTIEEVLQLCQTLYIPAVFDNLHHALNPSPLSWQDIVSRVVATWKPEDGRAKFHYSDQDLMKRDGTHAKTVVLRHFLKYLRMIEHVDADVMLEVKDKEVSALKVMAALDPQLPVRIRTDQWARYKYLVMAQSYAMYKQIGSYIQSDIPMTDIYLMMEECLDQPFDEGNYVNAILHLYGYVKEDVSGKEKEQFMELMKNPGTNKDQIKQILHRLVKKYGSDYIQQSYFFLY